MMNEKCGSKHVLAIDIGNTRTKFGLVDLDAMNCIVTRFVPTDVVREQLVPMVLDIFERYDKSFGSQIIIASGIKVLAEIARNRLSDLFPDKVKVARYIAELPFKCSYKKPLTLGVDRLANVLYGYTAFSGKNCILISMGTAVTIDGLIDGAFAGGTILPGIRTQLTSLKQSTDALPIVLSSSVPDVTIPGQSTEECICSGVLYGMAGAVERIVAEYHQKYGSDTLVLATGGDWEQIEKLVGFEYKNELCMTLMGTALFDFYLPEGTSEQS